jgi:hypothetical protein
MGGFFRKFPEVIVHKPANSMSTGSLNCFGGNDPLVIRTIVRPPEGFAGILQYGLRLLVQPSPPPAQRHPHFAARADCDYRLKSPRFK